MAMNNRLMRPKATAAAAPPVAPALYFSSQAEYPLAWELTNWFQNAACTIPATALPTSADDVVFLTNADNLDAPAIFECRNLTATGVTLYSFYEMKIVAAGVVTLSNVFLFNFHIEAASIVVTDNSAGDGDDYSVILQAGSVTLTDFVDTGVVLIDSADAQLFGSGEYYNITGNAIFNNETILNGTVTGNATFNGASINYGTVTGNATFNDASNNYGIVEGTITCNTTGVCSSAVAPAAPTSLSGTAGDAQVALSWTAPSNDGGAAITDYTVQYSTDSGSTWTTFSRAASTATSVTVTGLTNGTAHTFRVAAVNSAGTGAYTGVRPLVVPRATPDEPSLWKAETFSPSYHWST
jgi:hypothetical protein